MATAIQLHAERPRIAKRPTLHKAQPAPGGVDVAALQAIMNRWNDWSGTFGGTKGRCCADCDARLAAPYSCDICGYSGEPYLMDGYSCGCGGCTPGDGCGHGDVECPVCNDVSGSHGCNGQLDYAWEIIRDIRAALNQPTSPAPIVQRLAAILDQPNRGFFGDESLRRCECKGCRRIRSAGHTCDECGFHGEPIVVACECREIRASNIAFSEARIAKLEASEPIDTNLSLDSLRDVLAIALASPDRVCRATKQLSENCGHGRRWCPTCGSLGDGRLDIDAGSLARTIRAIRKEMARP